jgi:glycerol-3-phosphate acyltransferase PlsY
MTYFLFIFLGFILGSTLFAYWIPRLFFNTDITKSSDDHNPGVANAYMQAGFVAGTLSLLFELLKGAVPVFFASRILDRDSLLFALVMAAPVFGHAFPFFQKERGGKAIAVSFGVMIGLFPEVHPLFGLIFYYILFSLVITLRPHSFRSVITYGLFTLTVFLLVSVNSMRLGCFIISAIVIYRHVIRYHDEALQALLFGKYPLFHKS